MQYTFDGSSLKIEAFVGADGFDKILHSLKRQLNITAFQMWVLNIPFLNCLTLSHLEL